MERLRSHRDFVNVLKQHDKVSSRDLVVHYCVRPPDSPQPARGVRMGLAVARGVGHAVTRNTVKRRFRASARAHEDLLPGGIDIVLRAKPSAASAAYASLDGQIAALFRKINRRIADRGQVGRP